MLIDQDLIRYLVGDMIIMNCYDSSGVGRSIVSDLGSGSLDTLKI